MISIFDIFKIGIGPSSSHTVGPMKAAAAFADLLHAENLDTQVARIVIEVYGSLALTGIGHGTFDALLLGLEGSLPHDIPLADIPQRLERIRTQHVLKLNGREMAFNPEKDLDIRGDKVLPKHPNGFELYRLQFRRPEAERTDLLFGRRRFYRNRRGVCTRSAGKCRCAVSIQKLRRVVGTMPSEPVEYFRSRVGQ